MSDKTISTTPEELEKQKRKAGDQRLQQLEDLKWLMQTPQGVRFLRRLFTEGKIFSTTFTGNSTGMFLEGARNLALKFLADVVEADPNKLALLVMEPKPEAAEAEEVHGSAVEE